jgi:hypothetical protein
VLSAPCHLPASFFLSYVSHIIHACFILVTIVCNHDLFLCNLRLEMERASDKEKHIEVSITIGVKKLRF